MLATSLIPIEEPCSSISLERKIVSHKIVSLFFDYKVYSKEGLNPVFFCPMVWAYFSTGMTKSGIDWLVCPFINQFPLRLIVDLIMSFSSSQVVWGVYWIFGSEVLFIAAFCTLARIAWWSFHVLNVVLISTLALSP